MEAPEFCVPHQYHPDRTLRAGDVFVTEISTTFWGYAGQILRTFTIASDPTPRYAAPARSGPRGVCQHRRGPSSRRDHR